MSADWPKMYRTMLWTTSSAEGPLPLIGTDRDMLGVVVSMDVHPDEEGRIEPCGEGLSVAPSLQDLPSFLVPERLRHRRRGARGRKDVKVFRAGATTFRQTTVGERLELVPTSKTHGVVQPRCRTLVDDYQADLAATQPWWMVDEE